MEKKTNLNIYNTLFFRIYLYFGIVLSFFAVLIGFIFMNLYEKSTADSYQQQLEAQGENIANKVSKYVINQDLYHYGVFKEVLDMNQSNSTDIWIISNPNAVKPMGEEYANVSIQEDELSLEVNRVITSAFHGEVDSSSSFDENYGKRILNVGTPIHDEGGNVIGAVLLNSYVESQQIVIDRSQRIIVNSTMAALFLSIIIAILFARQISRPISKIRVATMELAEGNYQKKTGIEKKDEIGELASSIDILAERLQQNLNERQNMEQMRQDFFANVSHELRTPITVIRGYTETLVDGVVTEKDRVDQYYKRMLLECKSMERLVGDLLTLSKLQNPDFEIDAEPVNVIQIINNIIRSAKTIGQKKNITLDVQKDSDCCMMMGDYDRIRQAFMVILDNAMKFSHENGTVFITIESHDQIKISIRDEGIGISEEEIPSIFEKFYKSKLRQNAQGTGLGLMIAKQIVNKHGGTIGVSSKVGEGTTFEITFEKMELNEGITEKNL